MTTPQSIFDGALEPWEDALIADLAAALLRHPPAGARVDAVLSCLVTAMRATCFNNGIPRRAFDGYLRRVIARNKNWWSTVELARADSKGSA